MTLYKNHRVAILVDYPNLVKSSLQFHKSLINLNCFMELVADCLLIRAIVFMSSNGLGKPVQHVLKKIGFEINIVSNGKSKIECDGPLMLSAISIADKIDTLILGSGDGDYCELVKYLRYAKGVRTIVMCIEKSASYELLELADEFRPITSFLKNN